MYTGGKLERVGLPLDVVLLYFSNAGKVDQHVLNAKAVEFIPRFSTTSGFGTDKVAKLERGYVLY